MEYRGDSLAYPLPFVSLANSVSTRLGHFTIKTLQINSRHPHIKTFCAGRESSVRSKRKIYVNNQLNVPFDIGSDFTYNKSTSTFQKELRLIEDIVCHIIDIELESYDADFPLHCGQIARKNGLLEFIIGLLPNGGTKLEYVEITVPFKFLGVADGFVPPPVVAPAEVPSDFKAPVGPPQPASSNSYPKDMKSPDGPRGYEPPQGPPVQESYTPPQGPPPGNNTFDIAPPPGPPPGSHAGDIAPPQGPPPGSYPNRAPTENLIDLETPEEVPPSYTSVAK